MALSLMDNRLRRPSYLHGTSPATAESRALPPTAVPGKGRVRAKKSIHTRNASIVLSRRT
ncbi:hypothetical protein K443DRAFT_508263 [Laccaria amethystina LaAM-08-1]|uniref:Uncharacterized protein n=1 Tax=Laccaria amethystina LaAM-08-1 TaxID=1095629 RepID=A0A0C9XD75_9AGAR|nr:hypothetical protein K443DRAFT_508263 [Laccaria amethystina LaAM-08-1]